jgi:hypothetical protein
MSLRPSLARAPGKARRREAVPDLLREEVISFGRLLAELFGPALTANPGLKFAAARLFAAQLPPLPRPPGRPGYKQVNEAIRLREEATRLHPERSHKQIWQAVYPTVIFGYHSLPAPERRDAEDQLRQRVRWRLSARRRRAKKAQDLSVL